MALLFPVFMLIINAGAARTIYSSIILFSDSSDINLSRKNCFNTSDLLNYLFNKKESIPEYFQFFHVPYSRFYPCLWLRDL
jgi:hypothetical protein